MSYKGNDYYFRKNMLGDVCAIYNAIGDMMCRYVYDAWGNHKIYDSNGNEIEDNGSLIGSINSFRYRGYYWDREFGLYYLKSRYYDPVTGRFISPDSIEYLDPASISGMNLYAYCGNNPVMYTDPEGHFAITGLIIAGIIGGAIIGGLFSASKAHAEGQSGWEFFGSIFSGALLGSAMGGILALGGGIGAAAALGTTATIAGTTITFGMGLGIAAVGGTVAGMSAYAIESAFKTDVEFSGWGLAKSAFIGISQGISTFFIGYFAGRNGVYDKPFLKEFFDDSVGMGLGRGILDAILKSPIRDFITNTIMVFGNFLAKLFLVSSIAAGVRALIDLIFGD